LFAADCAEAVPQGKAGKAAIRAARRYAFGLIREDALDKARVAAWVEYSVARAAARSAAYSAASSAARASARFTAYSAALSSALSAALSAARPTSYSAALSSARTAQAARLHDYLLGKVDLNAIRDKVA
jgi:hypothetical protein